MAIYIAPVLLPHPVPVWGQEFNALQEDLESSYYFVLESVELFRRSGNDWGKSTLQLFGIVLLGVVGVWLPVGFVVYLVRPGYFLFTPANYYNAVLTLATLLTTICITSLWLISRFGLLNISLLASFLIICATLTRLLFFGTAYYAEPSVGKIMFCLLVLPIGGAVLLNANKKPETESRFKLSMKNWAFRLLLVFYAGSLILTVKTRNQSQTLPIDILIQNGREQHEMYLNQAKVSNNLKEAVLEYKRRYNQYPPPGFDQWYDFATSRNSPIIDDFDQIYSDLAPFRAYPPHYLRRLTHGLATDSFSDVGAIRIRNGSSRAQEGVKPTHAWMVQATMEMLNAFVEYLPDMDILLNLNDEPRVAIPRDAMFEMRRAAKPADFANGPSPINE
ncbi:hypothetical protein PISL3812_07443 [Talaromyces islandicus]|uniref:Uncharacterized protein n=1 Tax=Talaromyces islandicus TaxID=28573 RepID=A0A0U1M494_TALIS|nr:hypothetical protein PISL3812_07443 [Talaromyces islandicus]